MFCVNIFLVSSLVRAIPDAIVGFPSIGIYKNAGILFTPNTAASSRSTCVSILYTITSSANSPATSSNIGAAVRQGPHQSA